MKQQRTRTLPGAAKGGRRGEPRPRGAGSAGSDAEHARTFVARWALAGRALEAERRRRLQVLDDRTARAAARELQRLRTAAPRDRPTSGLVEQQRLFRALADASRRRHRP